MEQLFRDVQSPEISVPVWVTAKAAKKYRTPMGMQQRHMRVVFNRQGKPLWLTFNGYKQTRENLLAVQTSSIDKLWRILNAREDFQVEHVCFVNHAHVTHIVNKLEQARQARRQVLLRETSLSEDVIDKIVMPLCDP